MAEQRDVGVGHEPHRRLERDTVALLIEALHEVAGKVLLVISDGRPFDLDYGQQYGEEAVTDYALADTPQALAEARRLHVRPYLRPRGRRLPRLDVPSGRIPRDQRGA